MKRLLASWTLLAVLPWSLASAELPYTFNAGDPIRASELNANFQYLDSLSATGSEGLLVRRQTTMSSSGFSDVATVPGTATNGWVLRSYATGCGDPILKIDSDPSFQATPDTRLVVKAGETLKAKCKDTTASTIGYFMFDEQ